MRPKKRILLIDPDEFRASVLKFRLHISGYAVFITAYAAEAEQLCGEVIPDVIVAAHDLPGLAELLPRLHRSVFVPQMVIAPKAVESHVACDCFLVNPPAAELLERLKVLSQRKRGPKKGVGSVTAEDLAAQRIA